MDRIVLEALSGFQLWMWTWIPDFLKVAVPVGFIVVGLVYIVVILAFIRGILQEILEYGSEG